MSVAFPSQIDPYRTGAALEHPPGGDLDLNLVRWRGVGPLIELCLVRLGQDYIHKRWAPRAAASPDPQSKGCPTESMCLEALAGVRSRAQRSSAHAHDHTQTLHAQQGICCAHNFFPSYVTPQHPAQTTHTHTYTHTNMQPASYQCRCESA